MFKIRKVKKKNFILFIKYNKYSKLKQLVRLILCCSFTNYLIFIYFYTCNTKWLFKVKRLNLRKYSSYLLSAYKDINSELVNWSIKRILFF